MIQIKDFIRPKSLEEAAMALSSNRNAAIVGGGAFLRLGSKNISTAVDLSGLELNTLVDEGDKLIIGAMVTFGQLERSHDMKAQYFGLFAQALSDVVGVQFRNTVTVGGTVFSRYGFSDLLPPLLVLNADVVLHQGGKINLNTFLQRDSVAKDILTHVHLPKNCTAASFKSVRHSTGDYAVLNLALAQVDGIWRVAVGARPGRAQLALGAMELLNHHAWTDELLAEASYRITQELVLGSNTRGSAGYRQLLAGVLLKKAVMEVRSHVDPT